jgi:hypothetical protein
MVVNTPELPDFEGFGDDNLGDDNSPNHESFLNFIDERDEVASYCMFPLKNVVFVQSKEDLLKEAIPSRESSGSIDGLPESTDKVAK